jgi:hypothetical protein
MDKEIKESEAEEREKYDKQLMTVRVTKIKKTLYPYLWQGWGELGRRIHNTSLLNPFASYTKNKAL